MTVRILDLFARVGKYSCDRAVIFLSGLPQLNNTLRLAAHELLRQRIVMNYDLDGMSKEEGRRYIQEKLNITMRLDRWLKEPRNKQKLRGEECTQSVFEENALEAVLNAANGTPRFINKLCNASLLGNSRNPNLITADAVMQAISEYELA